MRLIEADTLTEELSGLTTTITGLRAGKGVLREFMTEYRKSVLRIVDEQPTIDAVPVVRCKDCKRCYEKRTRKNRQLMRFCMRMDGNEFQVNADDFCSYGKRKDNG